MKGTLTTERFPGVAPDDAAAIEAIYQNAFTALYDAILSAVASPGSVRASPESCYTLFVSDAPHPHGPLHLSGLGHGTPVQHAHLSLIQHGGWQIHATALRLDCGTRHLLIDGREAPRAKWGRGVAWSAEWERAIPSDPSGMMAHLWRSPRRAWFSLLGWRYDPTHPLLWLLSPKESR